jgi:archaemetzincin
MDERMNDGTVVVGVGPVETDILAYLCRAISETLHQDCRVGADLPLPDDALNARRRQYSANTILGQLSPGGAGRVLGVVNRDLYVPELNFLFGLADPREQRAVIALPRLRETAYGRPQNRALFLERAAKEAIHELGHTYGLAHCSDPRCVMAFSHSLAGADYKGPEFCSNCQRELRGGDAKRKI